MNQDENTNAREIATLAIAATGLREINGIPHIALPEDFRLHSLEETLPNPKRKRGIFNAFDLNAFVRIVNKHKDESTEIYRNTIKQQFAAVFNDHDGPDGDAGWRDFRATYNCPFSKEWAIWHGADKKKMTQEEFAQFIEDNLPDIVNPPAADMLEISRSLEAKKKVNFASGIRLANGENQLTYEESIEGTASRGQLKVPEVFTVGIPVFEGGPRYAVTARLRYRIADGGKLSMWFDIERAHKIIEDAFKGITDEIEKQTALTTINADTAPAARSLG